MKNIYLSSIDLETSGLDEQDDEIIQIAIAKTKATFNKEISIYEFSDLETFEAKINPIKEVPDFIAKINNYDKKVWEREAVETPSLVYKRLFGMMEGSWHVGSNPGFDERFLRKAAKNNSLDYPKLTSYHPMDVVMEVGFPLYLKGKIEKLKLNDLCKYFKLGEEKHEALDDALKCLKLLKINFNNIVQKH